MDFTTLELIMNLLANMMNGIFLAMDSWIIYQQDLVVLTVLDAEIMFLLGYEIVDFIQDIR